MKLLNAMDILELYLCTVCNKVSRFLQSLSSALMTLQSGHSRSTVVVIQDGQAGHRVVRICTLLYICALASPKFASEADF